MKKTFKIFKSWCKDDGATAAIEAGLLFPILVALLCGTMDTGFGLITSKKVINATQMVSDAIASGNAQAINYFVAQKYVEAVSQFATSPNAKTILFPVEATQLIGTLGGIGELARDALERKTEA